VRSGGLALPSDHRRRKTKRRDTGGTQALGSQNPARRPEAKEN
jgi:hypothetical protein